MFARRGFNIESLAVGETERHDVSRITLRVDCETHSLEQIEKQMHKLVNVLRVTELAPGESLERELALLKVSAPPSARAELMALGEVFNARDRRPGPRLDRVRARQARRRRSIRSRSSSVRTVFRSSFAPAGSASAERRAPRAARRRSKLLA